MPELKTILGEIATEASDGSTTGCSDRATLDELSESKKQTPQSSPMPSVWDIQRRQQLDFIMGRGPKPLDGSCRDRRDNGVLDD